MLSQWQNYVCVCVYIHIHIHIHTHTHITSHSSHYSSTDGHLGFIQKVEIIYTHTHTHTHT